MCADEQLAIILGCVLSVVVLLTLGAVYVYRQVELGPANVLRLMASHGLVTAKDKYT